MQADGNSFYLLSSIRNLIECGDLIAQVGTDRSWTSTPTTSQQYRDYALSQSSIPVPSSSFWDKISGPPGVEWLQSHSLSIATPCRSCSPSSSCSTSPTSSKSSSPRSMGKQEGELGYGESGSEKPLPFPRPQLHLRRRALRSEIGRVASQRKAEENDLHQPTL